MEGIGRKKITFKAFVKKSFHNMSRYAYRNKFVSFILFMAGAVFVTSIFPGDFTPTAAQRVEWRRERMNEKQEKSTELTDNKEK